MTSAPKNLAEFLANHTEELDALRAEIAQVTKDSAPLGLSYESIDRVEDYYRRVLDAPPPADQLERVKGRIVRYVGQTVIEHTKGAWAIVERETGPALVVEVPGIKENGFHPLTPVAQFKRLRWPGLIRDDAEKWDMPRRRADLARLLSAREEELAHLRDDIEQLTGKRLESLDGKAATLKLIEQALKKLAGPDARDRRREVGRRVVLFLGSLVEKATGETWRVVDNAKEGDFGEFRIGSWWAPARDVGYVVTTKVTGRLHESLKLALKPMKKR
jgi:hypothetical protein